VRFEISLMSGALFDELDAVTVRTFE